MINKEYYIDLIENLIKEIKTDNKRILIFGASRGGWYIKKVLEYYNITVDYFIDNIKNGYYEDIEILTPQKAYSKNKNFKILVGILNPKNSDNIIKKLDDIGYSDICYLMDAFIFIYFYKILNRSCDKNKLAESIYKYYNNDECRYIFSPTISYVITQKCTLNCLNCGAFVQDYKEPKTLSPDIIISDIEKYCSAFDVVHHIALQGGEPFLNKSLGLILKELRKIPNLLFIDIVTNGTLIPSGDIINEIFATGSTVIISDYGEYSKKLKELSSLLHSKNIHVDYYEYEEDGWGKQTPIFPRNRSSDKNDKIFNTCIKDSRLCVQIVNGTLYRCSFSLNTSELQLIPDFPEDYVKLKSYEKNSPLLKEKILALTQRTSALKACDYCPALEREMVPAGIQIKNK